MNRKPRKRRSNNPDGRPSLGLTEASVLLRAPQSLVDAVASRAKDLGLSTSEAWRRAAAAWLATAVE